MKEYKDSEEIKQQLRIWVQECEDWLEQKEADCFRDCIDLIDQFPAADPIREMGGCYCWECEEEDKGHCRKLRGIPTIQIGFCGYGRRREDV